MKKKIVIPLIIIAVSAVAAAAAIVIPTIVKKKNTPKFSEDKLFSLRIYEPWIYESLHYTVLTDGTLIVEYYGNELDREQLPKERMDEIHKLFDASKVYNMDVGKEDDMTDGVTTYIVLYDENDNEIQIGGYEMTGKKYNDLWWDLYELCEDDFTKVWSDRLDECFDSSPSFRELYIDSNRELP